MICAQRMLRDEISKRVQRKCPRLSEGRKAEAFLPFFCPVDLIASLSSFFLCRIGDGYDAGR
jgi:hypothetical protein